jgi:hypothetical protein
VIEEQDLALLWNNEYDQDYWIRRAALEYSFVYFSGAIPCRSLIRTEYCNRFRNHSGPCVKSAMHWDSRVDAKGTYFFKMRIGLIEI